MYIVIKLLIDKNTIDEEIFYEYQNVYTKEAKRAATYVKKTNEEMRVKCVSDKIHGHTKYEVLKEANKLNNIKKLKANYKLNPIWRSTSYTLEQDAIILKFGQGFKIPTTKLNLFIRDYQREQMNKCKLHSAKLKKSGKYWYVYLTASIEPPQKIKSDIVMGIDLGIRVPAVCVTSSNKVKFIGNGRYIRFVERNLNAKYTKLEKAKNKVAIKKMNHKLANIKQYLDHKYSKEIIDFALLHNVSVIKLERLTGLQKEMVKKRMKKEHMWSYYRLQCYLEEKAKIKGIQIIYVPAHFTSKRCPQCGKLNSPKGRNYICSCGYKGHRDFVGAYNIMRSTGT